MNDTLLKHYNEALELVDGDKAAAAQLVLASMLGQTQVGQPMTVPEVAKFLRVRPDKVLAWIRSGRLRGYNVAEQEGGRPSYRVNPSDLESFIQQRTTTKPSPKRKPKRSRVPVIERPTRPTAKHG